MVFMTQFWKVDINIVQEASKYMSGIPSDIGDCIHRSLCAYTGYFPNLPCILCINAKITKIQPLSLVEYVVF